MSKPERRVYLDFNATAPLRPAVRDAVVARMLQPGNASSVHAEGRAARAVIETARAEVSQLVGAPGGQVVFTSGATEAAAFALSPDLGAGSASEPARLILGAIEHPAVRDGHRFPADRVAVVPVQRDGRIDLEALARLLAEPGRAVVALQAANGETGVVQPVGEAASLTHAAGGLLVCDAVQAAGRVPCTADNAGADVFLLSAHKLGGPQGVGAAVAARRDLRFGAPLLRGGGQERGARSGTENAAGIVGFGVAARMARDEAQDGVLALRHRFEAGLRALAPDVVIFGEAAPRLPNTVAFAIPGLANATALIALDLAGFAVSTGSACSSGKVSRSEVLAAMGVAPDLSAGLLRVSLGWSSTEEDVDGCLAALSHIMQRTGVRSARAAA